MRNYWLKIFGGMALIFVVGLGIRRAFSSARSAVHTGSSDISIPLGSLVPFRADGVELGRLRSITLVRSDDRRLEGVNLSIRVTDSSAFDSLKNCKLSVADPEKIDPGSSFICLKSDSGYAAFGEVRVSIRRDGDLFTHVSPFYLPESKVQEIRLRLLEELVDEEAIRTKARAMADSTKATDLELEAERLRRQADSLRRGRRDTSPSAATPRPAA